MHLFRVVRDNLDLDAHVVLAEARDADAGPQRLVARHVLAEVAHHGLHRLVVKRHVVRVHPEHLLPPLAPRIPQIQLHVRERPVDLRVNLPIDLSRRRVPSACDRVILVVRRNTIFLQFSPGVLSGGLGGFLFPALSPPREAGGTRRF